MTTRNRISTDTVRFAFSPKNKRIQITSSVPFGGFHFILGIIIENQDEEQVIDLDHQKRTLVEQD